MANEIKLINYSTVYKAAIADDWETAKRIFVEENNAFNHFNAYLEDYSDTPLHIAVGTQSSNRFVQELVDWIIQVGDVHMLRICNKKGDMALHYAAIVGNTQAARLLINKDTEMAQITNRLGHTALRLAAQYGRKETLCYLLEVTKDVSNEEGISPYRGQHGADLLALTVYADFYDVALYLVHNYPNLVTEKNTIYTDLVTALQVLAAKPNAFQSGSKLRSWQRIVYSWIPVNEKKALESPISKPSEVITSQKRSYQANKGFMVSIWSALQYMAPNIKQIHESKVTHIQSKELLRLMCFHVMDKGDKKLAWNVFGRALSTAVKYGIYELIEQCFHHYPVVIKYQVEGMNLIMAAVSERQEKVYNLVYQMSGHKVFTSAEHAPEGNALHIAGKLAPPHRLDTVTGAALQMQRELQWFKNAAGVFTRNKEFITKKVPFELSDNPSPKLSEVFPYLIFRDIKMEVEKFVLPSYKGHLNSAKKTPKMVFSSEHKELLNEAKQWIKDTSSSGTVIAALIVTMAFAAIFTAPGGNSENGKPLFLREGVFILFALSDAIALFSSSTSVMMFLAALNSRFAEEDFLYALPKRLMLGLISLFISIAATMVAFSATLSLVLRDEIRWIAAPVILLASIPVTLFLLLQYPLLVELVRSTYGRGIFYQQSKLLLH